MGRPVNDGERHREGESLKSAAPDSGYPWQAWLPGISLIVTLGITLFVWQDAARHNRVASQQKFEYRATQIETAIIARMQAYEQVLQGTAGMFAASDDVSRDQFKAYVNSLDLHLGYPGIQGIGFAKLVAPAEKNRLVERIRAEGFPDFRLKPDGARDAYSAIVYLEPFDWRNQRAFGYDMYSNMVRRIAMDRSWQEGVASLTGKVTLLQETDKDVQAGALMYVPVYWHGLPHATPLQREKALHGWVYAPFRMNDLMRGIVERHFGEAEGTIDLEIFDGSEPSQESLLYDNDDIRHSLSGNPSAYKMMKRITVAGRVWTIAMYAMPAFDAEQDRHRLGAIAIVGIIGSLMLSLLLWLLVNGGRQALALAEEMSRDVRERSRQLKEAQSIAHIGSWDWHVASDRLVCSDELYRLFGLDQQGETTSLETFLSAIHPDDREQVRDAMDAALNRGIALDMIPRVALPDGMVREVHAQGHVEYAVDGRPQRMFGTILDITERHRAEETLRQALAELDDLYDHAPCGYHSLDGEGRVVRINQTELDWLGYTREEMLGRRFTDMLSADGLATFKENYPAFKTLGYVRELEYELMRKDGTTITVLLSATAVYNGDGQYVMSRSTLFDITARKQAERELERTRSQLQRIVDANPAAIYRVQLDPDGVLPPRVSFLSGNIVELAGYAQDEWAEQGFWEAHIHPDDRASVLATQAMLFEQGTLEHEYRFQRRDGEVIWIYDRLVLIRDSAGRPAEIVGTWLDISGRVRAEQSLLRLSRFHAILSHVNEAIVRVQDEDQLFREICRIAVEEGGMVMAWVGILDGVQEEVVIVEHAGWEEGYLRFLAERGVFRRNGPTARAIVGNSPYINNDMAGNPVMGPWREEALQRGYRSSAAYPLRRNGRPVGALTLYADQPDGFTAEIIKLFKQLADDVSFAMDFHDQDRRRREAERKLGQLNEELEQRVANRTRQLLAANKELESFSYSVSHDLRAPLRSIEGFSQILVRKYGEQLDATGKDYLQRVLRAGQRMGELIDDLLTLARVSRVELVRQQVDLSRVAREVAEDLQAGKPDRVAEFDIQDGIIVDADARLMRGVLENLLSNAWKFTARQAQPRIEFGKCEIDGKPAYFVRDNGAGFDMQYAGKLFGAFQRLHRTEDFEGTGIGLATVQRIVNRHGGTVWAEGEVDKGATIYFTLE